MVKTSIRKIRKQKGISLTALATLLGKSPGAMWKIENDRVTVSAEDLSKIAHVFGVSMDELVVRAEVPILTTPQEPPHA